MNRSLAWSSLAALLSACIVVSPLEDFPEAPETGSGGSSAGAGKGGAGGSKAGGGNGGTEMSAGRAGTGGKAGQGGGAGLAGSASEGGAGAGGEAGDAGAAGDAGSGGSGGCTTNRECVLAGGSEPYRCRTSDRSCVPLKTSDCPLVYPNDDAVYSNPNALYVGAFATLQAVRPDENSVVWAQRLAIEELSGDNVRGLPGGPERKRRPLVMIVCNNDTATDDETIDRGIRHLTEEVEVPAVLATLKPGDLVRAFEEHRRGEVFFLDPVSATSTVVNYDDDDLIWTMLGPPKDYAQGYRALLENIEAYLRRTRNSDPSDKIKVALVSTPDAFNDELKNFVEPVLRFNGLNVTDNGAAQYLSVTIDTNLSGEDLATQIDEISSDILEFRPDVVISTAGERFTGAFGLLESIETTWDDGSGFPRPFYLLSPYNAGNTQNVVALLHSEMTPGGGGQALDAEAYKRFVGLSAAGAEDLTLQNEYAARLIGKFPNAIIDTGNYYDSVYFLAYSMFASGAVVPTGPQIAKGMRRLIAGDRFDVGPTPIADVFDALGDPDTSIELYGTLGPPDFDADTGVRIGTSSVFCFDDISATTARPRFDVQRYDRDLGEFVGEFPCYPDFLPP